MPVGLEKTIIVGGGIGGLCTAIALRQTGLNVKVYEQAPVLGAVGAGITIWPNAIKVFRRLGVADRILSTGARIRRAELRNWRGRVMSRSEPGELEEKLGEPTVAIHRADLHSILLSALPEGLVHLGKRCVELKQGERDTRVTFEGGEEERTDLLVGADGIHSVLRQQMMPEAEPRYSGYTAWRGVVETEDEAALGVTNETWGRGTRFGFLRIDSKRVYWFATTNSVAGKHQTPAENKMSLLERFSGWHHPVELLIHSTSPDHILHSDIYDLEPMSKWSEGRAVLLGDAAHPTTPNMGQGACMAIESSLVLARCLEQEDDLAVALTRYEKERMPRTAWITRQSRKIGRLGQIENPAACAVRDWFVRVTPDAFSKRQFLKAASFEF
jgi:2-polyprenyl-6-methoxyphenol hydroxylase-like FAD-dependent oxidoreductase